MSLIFSSSKNTRPLYATVKTNRVEAMNNSNPVSHPTVEAVVAFLALW